MLPGRQGLSIHRHPVDVYSSYVRRGKVDGKADWARIGVAEFCAKYASNIRKARRPARRWPDAVLLVGYERFTTDPEAEFGRICAFLDEPFHLDAL